MSAPCFGFLPVWGEFVFESCSYFATVGDIWAHDAKGNDAALEESVYKDQFRLPNLA